MTCLIYFSSITRGELRGCRTSVLSDPHPDRLSVSKIHDHSKEGTTLEKGRRPGSHEADWSANVKAGFLI